MKRQPASPIPPEPPEGSFIRFSIGFYTFAAYRVDNHWWTTSSNVESHFETDKERVAWGVEAVTEWSRIVERADGPIDLAIGWETVGRGMQPHYPKR